MIIIPSRKLRDYLANPPGGELGWVLKEGAPEDVKQEFKKFRDTFRTYIADSSPNELAELKWLHDD